MIWKVFKIWSLADGGLIFLKNITRLSIAIVNQKAILRLWNTTGKVIHCREIFGYICTLLPQTSIDLIGTVWNMV